MPHPGFVPSWAKTRVGHTEAVIEGFPAPKGAGTLSPVSLPQLQLVTFAPPDAFFAAPIILSNHYPYFPGVLFFI